MKGRPKYYWLLLSGLIFLLISLITACTQTTSPLFPAIAVSPSSFSFGAQQGGPNPTSQLLRIQNSVGGVLNWSATDDADWLALSPTSGTSGGEIDTITLSVDASGMSAGDYSATITISASEASNSPQKVLVKLIIIPIAPITPTVGYSVSVAISPRSQSGLPGDTMTYSLKVTNRGTEADAYDLSATDDQGWTLTIPPTTSEIASVASEDITLSLTIPEEAAPQTKDEITVTITSQNDSTASDTAVCTAVVGEEQQPPPPTTPASVSISPSSTTTSLGDSFTIQLVIDSTVYKLLACHVEINYDSNVFTAGTITEAGLLGTDILTEPGSGATDGLVKYGITRVAGNTPVPVSGTLISITFTVSDTASSGSYSLDLNNLRLKNENNNEIVQVVDHDGVVVIAE